MDTNGLSLSDIATVSGNGAFGGNNSLFMLILFAMIFGNGGLFGNRNGEYATAQAAASQQEILFNQHFNSLGDRMDRGFTSIGNGISDATFSLNNTIVNGNNTVAGAVVAEGRATSEKLCDIKSAIHAEGEATRAMIQQNKIETLQAEVNDLKTQNMFCGIPRISPYGYVPVNTTNGCGGCGCNNI